MALNDTVEPNEIAPSLLVFGTIPVFPLPRKVFPNQLDVFKAMKLVRDEP